jgi:hypothetical protein
MTVENFGVTVSKIERRKSEEERLAQKKMDETLEFIIEDVKFPESHDTAIHRLKCTERLLEKVDDSRTRKQLAEIVT